MKFTANRPQGDGGYHYTISNILKWNDENHKRVRAREISSLRNGKMGFRSTFEKALMRFNRELVVALSLSKGTKFRTVFRNSVMLYFVKEGIVDYPTILFDILSK